ncbi:O-Glycosyl hydrolases family 17 protein [Actinidia rufa]|uniref:O-Glycosyl hydrolases family 17 protein n=1 Tax=Actinidia rufa TaxID=165716 RepID=A0A7J0HG38_9ERIC|nr:O-Glycosyl hydrolases family 17 protein [Actinidia rufa]
MATPNFLRSVFLAIIFSLYYFPIASLSDPGLIGINYGRVANDLPQPSQVVQLLKSQGVTRVKLYDTDQTALSAFSGSGISVTVALPNELLSSSAADQSFTDTWVKSNIVPYTPATQNRSRRRRERSLRRPEKHHPISRSRHEKLSSNKPGPILMVNAYPFFAYTGNTAEISLDYALFRDKQGVVDSGNGLRYYSLFDAQIDAVFAAMNALQYDDVKMVITETGWPSKGDENEAGSSAANAAAYNGNLVRRVLTGGGSPLRPNEPLNVFLFALFNENQKTGPTSERNYGLFYPNEEKVYNIPLTLEDLNTGESTPVNGTRMQVPAPQTAEIFLRRRRLGGRGAWRTGRWLRRSCRRPSITLAAREGLTAVQSRRVPRVTILIRLRPTHRTRSIGRWEEGEIRGKLDGVRPCLVREGKWGNWVKERERFEVLSVEG